MVPNRLGDEKRRHGKQKIQKEETIRQKKGENEQGDELAGQGGQG